LQTAGSEFNLKHIIRSHYVLKIAYGSWKSTLFLCTTWNGLIAIKTAFAWVGKKYITNPDLWPSGIVSAYGLWVVRSNPARGSLKKYVWNLDISQIVFKLSKM
jgi:hypothetical protein